ncbi:hypothetical protein PIB30_012225, partial [Stylosanthes scabra]|nr:hypothetical protein [Stylosanthes scabra]
MEQQFGADDVSNEFSNKATSPFSSPSEAENTDNEEAEQQLYELLLEMTGSKSENDEDIGEILDFCEEFDSDYKEGESDKEGDTKDEWGKEAQNDEGKGLWEHNASCTVGDLRLGTHENDYR